MRLVHGQESVMLFRLTAAGLLQDMKSCRMVSDRRYVICDSSVGRMWLISLWVVGNLIEISRYCWKMCTE